MELPPEAERYRLGEFILDLSRFQLTHRGELVPLQAKALDLLAALVRAGGEVVDHDALHRSLWPDVVVTDQSLRQAAMKLRKGLGERADLVETVPRRGLRWAGPIEREADGEPRAASPEPIAALVERDTFLGRTGELSSIEQAFASGSRVVSLVGPPRGRQDEARAPLREKLRRERGRRCLFLRSLRGRRRRVPPGRARSLSRSRSGALSRS